MIKDIQEKILKLKKEKNAVILAHSYQSHEILEVADETGDSYALSVAATKHDCENFIMCGVHFMAETVKMLSENNAVFAIIPPVTALLESQTLERECVAWPELGMEALYRIKVKGYQAIIAAAHGKSIYLL